MKVEYARDAVPFVEGGGAPRPSDSSGKMLYASLCFGQSEVHLGVALCAAGLANTQRHREGDDRSESYDDMVPRYIPRYASERSRRSAK